jgi:hypothetical protein
LEFGVTTNYPLTSAVLVQSSWSMWEVVLPALGFRIVKSCAALDSDNDLLNTNAKFCFLHGSFKFVLKHWLIVADRFKVVAHLDWGEKSIFGEIPSASWKLIQHRLCDGVTSGSWWCGTSFRHETKHYPKDSGRRLKHILTAMAPGRTVTAWIDNTLVLSQPLWTPDGFHCCGLLPVKSWNARSICPSVFKKWVSRTLTDAELRSCWDIGTEQVSEVSITSITKSVPAKVLLTLCRGLTDAQFPSFDSKEKLEQVVSSRGHTITSAEGTVPSPHIEESNLFPDTEGRQRAAKNDDVEIPIEYWDGPFWSTLTRMGRPVQFVETARNVTVGEHRRPILGALREWVLKLWRVSVRRSLQRYLKSLPSGVHNEDIEAGTDCLQRVGDATFWD